MQSDIFGTPVLVPMVGRALSSLGDELPIAHSYDVTSILEKVLRFTFSTSLRHIFASQMVRNSM